MNELTAQLPLTPLDAWLEVGVGPCELASEAERTAALVALPPESQLHIDALGAQVRQLQQAFVNTQAQVRDLLSLAHQQEQTIESQAKVIESLRNGHNALIAAQRTQAGEFERINQALSSLEELKLLNSNVSTLQGDLSNQSAVLHTLSQSIELFKIERLLGLWRVRLLEYTIMTDVKRNPTITREQINEARANVELYSQQARAMATSLKI